MRLCNSSLRSSLNTQNKGAHFTESDVMARWQMTVRLRAHTQRETEITERRDTHTQKKACFLFYKTEHYCKVDLFTIITSSISLPSVSLCSCVFLYFPPSFPLSLSSLSPTPTLPFLHLSSPFFFSPVLLNLSPLPLSFSSRASLTVTLIMV